MHKPRKGASAAGGRDADEPETADAVSRFARASLLVVGDAMLDRYVYGQLAPARPDSPAAVLEVERELAVPSGAASLVRDLTALSASVSFVSVVGDDQTGSDLTGLIGGQPGVEPWLLVQGGRATTLRTRYVADGRQIFRADQEDTEPIQPKMAERLLRIARDAMTATTATVLSDFGKGVLAGPTAAQLIGAARQCGRPVLALPHGADPAGYAGADVLVLRSGALAQRNGSGQDGESAAELAGHLRERHGLGAVVVHVDAGLILVDSEGAHAFAADPSRPLEIAVGGEALGAMLAAGLAAGLGIAGTMRLAGSAAELITSRVAAADRDRAQALAL